MSDLLSRRLALLAEPANLALLNQNLHGIERECLRVTPDANLALTEHSPALGAALTHPQITTDYSESLLEFITGTATDPASTLTELDNIHRFTYAQLNNELLWSASMPCQLPDEQSIPIARYGSSHIGQFKYVYRQGLALRYGKTMQCIAGIHYNFSLAESLWPLLQAEQDDQHSAQDFRSASYISLIRNFRRYSWMLMYLFGASPALDKSFMREREHQLQELDADTLYLPWATSLRMSDLGYQSSAQSGITACYNNLKSYTDSLRFAVATPYPDYAKIGTQDANGNWLQLNTNVLQIENEYYSTIRPKRVTYAGERPVQALMARGVQYVEVRCLDINPQLPLGIDEQQCRFLDVFLMYCALEDSPQFAGEECPACTRNLSLVAKQGRKPGLKLERYHEAISLTEWGNELLAAMHPVAVLLDQAHGSQQHQQALEAQRIKFEQPEQTPSGQLLNSLQARGISFRQLSLELSLEHAQHFAANPLSAELNARFSEAAERSLQEQRTLESEEQGDFETFLAAYQASVLHTAI